MKLVNVVSQLRVGEIVKYIFMMVMMSSCDNSFIQVTVENGRAQVSKQMNNDWVTQPNSGVKIYIIKSQPRLMK